MDPLDRILQARKLFERGLDVAAVDLLAAVLREFPENVEAHRQLAEIRFKQGRKDWGNSLLRRALRLEEMQLRAPPDNGCSLEPGGSASADEPDQDVSYAIEVARDTEAVSERFDPWAHDTPEETLSSVAADPKPKAEGLEERPTLTLKANPPRRLGVNDDGNDARPEAGPNIVWKGRSARRGSRSTAGSATPVEASPTSGLPSAVPDVPAANLPVVEESFPAEPHGDADLHTDASATQTLEVSDLPVGSQQFSERTDQNTARRDEADDAVLAETGEENPQVDDLSDYETDEWDFEADADAEGELSGQQVAEFDWSDVEVDFDDDDVEDEFEEKSVEAGTDGLLTDRVDLWQRAEQLASAALRNADALHGRRHLKTEVRDLAGALVEASAEAEKPENSLPIRARRIGQLLQQGVPLDDVLAGHACRQAWAENPELHIDLGGAIRIDGWMRSDAVRNQFPWRSALDMVRAYGATEVDEYSFIFYTMYERWCERRQLQRLFPMFRGYVHYRLRHTECELDQLPDYIFDDPDDLPLQEQWEDDPSRRQIFKDALRHYGLVPDWDRMALDLPSEARVRSIEAGLKGAKS